MDPHRDRVDAGNKAPGIEVITVGGHLQAAKRCYPDTCHWSQQCRFGLLAGHGQSGYVSLKSGQLRLKSAGRSRVKERQKTTKELAKMCPPDSYPPGGSESPGSKPSLSARWAIDDLILDLGRRELTRNGEPVELGRLTWSLLVALVEAAPNVLGHDEIIDKVWNGRATSLETVTQRIKLLRDALGDNADHPRYVGLVRGQGYRLIPSCRLAGTPATGGGVSSGLRDPGHWATRRGGLMLAGVATLVALGSVLFFSQWNARQAPLGPEGEGLASSDQRLPASIAVLPFQNLSSDPQKAYFALGFHDTLLSELATISGLRVIARQSVLGYADGTASPAQIARELQVRAVMDGSLQFDNEKVRVTATLIDPESGTQLWASSYDRPLDDVFAIQTDIAIAIAGALQAELLPSERRSIEAPPTKSAAAWSLYLEALVDTDRRRLPLENDRSRLPLLDRAIALDSSFAAARVERAMIHTWAVAYSEAGSSAEDIARRREYERLALEDAALAAEADPTLPGPWLVRGILQLESWHWPEAEASFKAALELAPNDPDVLLQYAYFLTYSGEFDQALVLARRRLVLDPQSVASNNGLAFIALAARQPQEALERFAVIEHLAPGVWFFHSMAALAHFEKGDTESAERALRTADALRGKEDMAVFLANSAIVYRRLGLQDDSRRAFEGFHEWTSRNVVSEGDWAMAYQGIGDYHSMYAALQRAVARIDAHEPDSHQALILVANNVTGDAVLEEPRFRALRARLLPPGAFDALQ